MTSVRFVSTLIVLGLVGCGASKSADSVPPEPAPAATPAETTPPPEPVAPIPEGWFSVTPALTVKDVDVATDFYVKAFGAEKLVALPGPDGKTMHGEIKIGDSLIMLEAENDKMKSAETLGGTPAGLMMYVADVDAAFQTAVDAGAKVEMPVADMFWGDRYGSIVDPFGLRWSMATHVEDLSDEQMGQRAQAAMSTKNQKAAAKKWKKIKGEPAKEPVPSQYHTVTPALTQANAAEAIEFYKAAFGAVELSRAPDPSGKLMHAELKIGDSIIMLSDEYPEMGGKSPKTLGGSPVALHYYTEDVDAAFAKATGAKATTIMPVADMFWGDRYGAVLDSSGFMWGIATHKEDVSPEEMAERMKKLPPTT